MSHKSPPEGPEMTQSGHPHEVAVDSLHPDTLSLRRTKVSLLYKRTGNLRGCRLFLGHTKLENTVRYLGIEVDDALNLSEQTEI